MKFINRSLILKIQVIMTITIIILFSITTYIFLDIENKLIAEIRNNNFQERMNEFDRIENKRISFSRDEVKEFTRILANILQAPLFNYDLNTLDEILQNNMHQKDIVLIKIWDSFGKSQLRLITNVNGKVEFIKDTEIKSNYEAFTEKIYTSSDKTSELAVLTVYYDKSIIINEINTLKENTKSKIIQFDKYIAQKQDETGKKFILIGILFLFALLAVIFILLIKTIKTPLYKFQISLNSFFENLKDSTHEIKLIELDSIDEIGQMNTSIIENIKISTKLHKDIRDLNIDLEAKIEDRTKELSIKNKNINDGIRHASLIQSSILPNLEFLSLYSKNYFIHWKPKINVGGDIYFMNELKEKNEIVIMVLDGVGHGVSGAFVTMILKAIENQIMSDLKQGLLESSPALIMSYFNKSIKMMFEKQKNTEAHIGFDGGILIINKKENFYKYSGAKTKLYTLNKDGIEILKGERKSVGFSHINENQTYKEHKQNITMDTKFYMSSDGLFDQFDHNDVSFTENRFKDILERLEDKPFSEHKKLIIEEFNIFKGNAHQTDDVVLMGIEINKTKN